MYDRGVVVRFSRRAFFGGVGAVGVAALVGTACAPKPTMAAARGALRGMWDAVVPGTHAGLVEDWLTDGVPAPGAGQAGVQEWFESVMGTLPPPLDFVADWFYRAWAADLDLWADTFHLPIDGGPGFGELPLGPTFAERGRQYKLMLMMKLFPGVIELKYLSSLLLAKMAFYGDFHAEAAGAERVGSACIGFPGPGAARRTNFTYNAPFGHGDPRMVTTPEGLVATP